MRPLSHLSFKKHANKALRAGFTLIEVLVVVAIMVALSGLLMGWIVSARRNQKVRSTQAAMSNLLLVTETVRHASPVFPDHRLANFFYVQPHNPAAAPGAQPIWNYSGNPGSRRMSSGEFLVFLASTVPSSNTMVTALGPEYLPFSSVPADWGLPADSRGPLVDVFEQDPSRANAMDKDKTSTSYSLVSPKDGYRLRTPVDAWGSPLAYRLTADRGDLNQRDTDSAQLLDSSNTPNGTYTIRENILQDEQFTRDRYAALGKAVDAPTASATTQEYVRPAVAAYLHPFFFSPGPDGIWGAFTNPARDALADAQSMRDSDAKDNIYSQESGR